jgi:hypothetical protein
MSVLALALLLSAPSPRAAAVEVEALGIEGALAEQSVASANDAVVQGLSRASLDVRGSCADSSCDPPDFIVTGALTIVDRDYAVRLEVRRPDDPAVVASTEGFCELCGVEEAIEMIEGRAAVLAPKLEQLDASAPVLMFESTPPGVEIVLDSASQGITPVAVQTEPGSHLVEANKPGYMPQSFEVQAVDGVEQKISLRLVPLPSEPPPNGRVLRIAGVASLSASVVALAAGVPLLVLHGRPYEETCNADATGRCQFDYDTQTGGIVGTAIGGALAATGAVLLGVGIRRGKRVEALSVGPGGVRLRF